ncbi:NAD(P)-dependent oxidoreductase [Clavibacter michiganensis subsp. phaseoli]|uniref:NAD(P)-dependent oxidoreductase n=1 Tax=Clavibacter phaseoli TaxID=1734031 RepID=UPI001FB39E41|nr:NAD(P)-dependent oxidoreductase [Clavibacter phaseoli]MCJ1709705.1 NAD(P)-dependent oxidoreductase [Clavibacter phaseoli]
MTSTDPLDPTTPRRIGVVGLGSMGGAMAASLAGRGWDVVGCDPSAAAREAAEARGLRAVADVSALAGIPYVVLSLPSARVVEATVPALLAVPGTVAVVDTTTSEPGTSAAMAELAAEHGAAFVDAPVSGGNTGAAAGTLASFVGGSAEAVAAARPVLEALTSGGWRHVGPAGSGNVVKLLNNMLVSVNLLAVAEAMDVAAAHGIDLDTAVAALNTATGASTVSQRMFPDQILSGRFGSGFALGLMARDVALAHDVARATGATPGLFAETDERWQRALAALGPQADFVAATSTFTTATTALDPAQLPARKDDTAS